VTNLAGDDVSDLFTFDIEDGIASGECPLCFAIELEIRRWLDSFWREGRQSPPARRRFFDAGGFCRRHAWLLHDLSVDSSGAAIADLYGLLCKYDLVTVDDLLGRRRRWSGVARHFHRHEQCSACVEEANTLKRKATFLLGFLATESGRSKYERSQGLCRSHLVAVLDEECDARLARYLLSDWGRRIDELRRRLAEYDRKRDHHYAAERTADDERACSDVIVHYVGAHP